LSGKSVATHDGAKIDIGTRLQNAAMLARPAAGANQDNFESLVY